MILNVRSWAAQLRDGRLRSFAEMARREGITRACVSQLWPISEITREEVDDVMRVSKVPVVIDDIREQEAKVPAEFKAVQWSKLNNGETSNGFAEQVIRLLLDDGTVEASRSDPASLSASINQKTEAVIC